MTNLEVVHRPPPPSVKAIMAEASTRTVPWASFSSPASIEREEAERRRLEASRAQFIAPSSADDTFVPTTARMNSGYRSQSLDVRQTPFLSVCVCVCERDQG